MLFVTLRVFETSSEWIPLGVVDVKLSKLLLITYYLTAPSGDSRNNQLQMSKHSKTNRLIKKLPSMSSPDRARI